MRENVSLPAEFASPQPCEWQPIETAPKDGIRVLLLETSFVTIGEWVIPESHTTSGTFYGNGRWREEHQLPLTHWMPIPSPPIRSGE